jgi:hypothetical protein
MSNDDEHAEMQWEEEGGAPVKERIATGQAATAQAADLSGQLIGQLTIDAPTQLNPPIPHPVLPPNRFAQEPCP